MIRAKTLMDCVFLSALLMVACGGDPTSDSDDEGEGKPTADLVGTWVFQSVTVNGGTQALADVMDWQAGTVAARMTIRSNGGYSMEEVNAQGQQTFFENGFVFVDGDEMDINILLSDGVTIDETIFTTFTQSDGTLTVVTLEDGDTIAFTLGRDESADPRITQETRKGQRSGLSKT